MLNIIISYLQPLVVGSLLKGSGLSLNDTNSHQYMCDPKTDSN